MRPTLLAALIGTLLCASLAAQEPGESSHAPVSAPVPAAAPAPVPAEEGAPPVLEDAPGRIVITGQRPGPGLWKVSKDEHVLWIFGTYGPLPKDLEWRSTQVEQILAQSQELIRAPRADYKPGFFQIVGMLPHLIGAQKNPDGSTLRERVPPEVYQRWLVLKQKYMGENTDVEKMRPLFAANMLHARALRHIGLTGSGQVDTRIAGLAKQYKLKVTSPVHKVEIDSPGTLLKQFKKTPFDDAACFAATLERLERDIDALRLRANAWARGDLDGWRTIQHTDHEKLCQQAMLTAVPTELTIAREMDEVLNTLWLDAVRQALAANRSSFAMLPLKRLMDPQGVLAVLRAQGYTITSPE